MSLAAFERILGARVPRLAAVTMWIGCSGAPEEAATSARPQDDASITDMDVRTADARLDASVEPAHDARSPEADRDVSHGSEVAVQVDGAADVAEDLPVCLRLDKDSVLKQSENVDDQYFSLVLADCRVSNVFRPPDGGLPAITAWRNLLVNWNFDLWGCNDHGAAGFALLSSTFSELSSADAALLIELYLKAATRELSLSPQENAQLKRDLERLAQGAVTTDSSTGALSACKPDAGDAGPDRIEIADASRDSKQDAIDAAQDTAADAPVDVATDSEVDAAPDGAVDAAPDGAVDAAPGSEVDAPTDGTEEGD